MSEDDQNRKDRSSGGSDGSGHGRARREGAPDYKVYRSRPGLFRWFRRKSPGGAPTSGQTSNRGSGPDRSGRESLRDAVPPPLKERPRQPQTDPGRPLGRRMLKWVALAVGAWLLVSILAFAASAQLQSMKLAGEARDALSGGPLLIGSAENILVIGTDARDPETLEPGAATSSECYEEQARGAVPTAGCVGTARGDTLMVLRAGGGGTFRQLSIPRDSYADVPGQGSQRINAAYAFGGAALQVETVEQFLGIDIGHVVILDFNGFVDLIDAIGGISVDVPQRTCGDISGGEELGGWTIRLRRGSNTLDGEEALAYARLRSPSPCPGSAPSAYASGYTDLDRAAAQQRVIDGIRKRLTNPLRIPENFVRGPWIGWAAPKAFVSDMGALSLPQLALAAGLPGGSGTEVLCGTDPTPCGLGPGGSIEVPQSERDRARNFLVEG